MRLRTIIAVLFSLFLIIEFVPLARVSSSGTEFPAFLFTRAQRYDPLAWTRGGERFSPDAGVFIQRGASRRPLIDGFAASADPTVSFDGKSVLFSGKEKATHHWQIWEVSLSGGPPRRVTSCAADCVRPLYLPDDRVVYAKKTEGRFVLETTVLTEAASSRPPLVLTYGPGNYFPSDVLHDGRILFQAPHPLGVSTTPELYTVYSDGSGVESYRCDHRGARHSGRQIASGDIVFTSGSGLGRFTSARAQEVPIAAPAGEYAGDAVEISPSEWLLSWRPDSRGFFQLKRWRTDAASLAALVADSNASVVQPALLVDRPVPKRHPSALHEWPFANLLCLNAYTSKYKFPAGAIHSVRVYARQDVGSRTFLGDAPVERDGSFFVQVPADRPLQIELLDGSGKILKRQTGWFWLRRGEQRACVGCHTGPETAPENAVPMILLKSTTPADLTGGINHHAAGGN